jgi:hypothetical protein
LKHQIVNGKVRLFSLCFQRDQLRLGVMRSRHVGINRRIR